MDRVPRGGAGRQVQVGVVCLCVLAALQVPTLHLSPTVSQDEAQILDLGHLIVEPASMGSLWFQPNGSRLPFPNYLGGAVQEAAYRLSGGAWLAPRLTSVGVALAAALVMVGWLVRRGTPVAVAFAIGAAFLLDPMFERSARGGRVEALAFFTAILACWAIAGSRYGPRTADTTRFVLVGGLVGLLPWIWPAAVLLLPLIAVELVRVVGPMAGWRPAAWRPIVVPLLLGMCGAVVVCAWPVRDELWSSLQASVALVESGQGVINPGERRDSGVWTTLVLLLRYSPWLPLLAIVGAVVGRQYGMGLAALAILVAVVSTREYLFRYLYMMPYFLVLAASALSWLWQTPPGAPWRAFRRYAPVGLVVLWACTWSLGVRNVVAWQEREWRDYDRPLAVMEQVVGRGPLTVYLGTWDLYYVGRQLDWHMVRFLYAQPEHEAVSLLRRVDVAVHHVHSDTPAYRRLLFDAGFGEGQTVQVNDVPPAFWPIRYGGALYSTYRVYRRSPH